MGHGGSMRRGSSRPSISRRKGTGSRRPKPIIHGAFHSRTPRRVRSPDIGGGMRLPIRPPRETVLLCSCSLTGRAAATALMCGALHLCGVPLPLGTPPFRPLLIGMPAWSFHASVSGRGASVRSHWGTPRSMMAFAHGSTGPCPLESHSPTVHGGPLHVLHVRSLHSRRLLVSHAALHVLIRPGAPHPHLGRNTRDVFRQVSVSLPGHSGNPASRFERGLCGLFGVVFMTHFASLLVMYIYRQPKRLTCVPRQRSLFQRSPWQGHRPSPPSIHPATGECKGQPCCDIELPAFS